MFLAENAAGVPAPLAVGAVKTALGVRLGRPEALAASGSAVALARGALRAMLLGKARLTAAMLLLLAGFTATLAQSTSGTKTEELKAPAATQKPTRPQPEVPDPKPPDHARMQLGMTRLRHQGQVTSVVFSPDRRTITSTSFNEVRSWDADTGAPAAGLPMLKEPTNVGAVAYSPDGRTLAIGQVNGVVTLRDPATGQERLRFPAHQNRIQGIAFAPDGMSFATTAIGDSHIRLWDAVTGRERLSLGTDGAVKWDAPSHWGALAFAHDGKRLAAAASLWSGQGEMIGIWNLPERGRPVIIPNAHKLGLHGLVFAPDGHTLISSGNDTKRIEGHDQAVLAVEFLPQLEFVPQLRLWDAGTGRMLRELNPGDATGECTIALSQDGKRLVSSHRDRLLVWDLASGRVDRTIPAELNNLPLGVASVALAPNARTLAAVRGDHTVHLWDLATGQPMLRQSEAHESAVVSIATAPGGRLLATGDVQGIIQLWDVTSGEHVRRIELGEQGRIGALRFTPDGRALGVAAEFFDYRTPPFRFRGIARVWRVPEGTLLREFPIDTAPTQLSRATRIAFSPDGRHVAIALTIERMQQRGPVPAGKSRDFVIRVFETATGRRLTDLEGNQDQILAVSFTADGGKLLSAGDEMSFRFWEIATGTIIRQIPITGHLGSDQDPARKPRRLMAAAFSPDARKAITSGAMDDQFNIWDLSLDRVRRHTIRKPENLGASLAVTADGLIFASASAVRFAPNGDDTTIRLWEMATGRELLRLQTGDRGVRSLAFSGDGRTLVSGMSDTTALVWDASAAYDALERP